MLSKRNLFMILTMFIIILVLFLSSVALKEYYNDYDINHAVDTELIEKKKQETLEAGDDIWNTVSEERKVVYLGTKDNGYYRSIKEWAKYRKKAFQKFESFDKAWKKVLKKGAKKTYLLVDGELLEKNTTKAVEKLSRYVEKGGIVIFYRLPSYQVIRECGILQDFLGIQLLRSESVKLYEIRLYSGFLLGGETNYLFEGLEEPELADMEREIPWYDISSRTKSYMVGFLSEEEKISMSLQNEDMPAIIWRSNLGKGSVFAVNGEYMKGTASLGILDAMIYETENYALYPVVNAQNFSVAGFPDLTVENEEKMAESYGMTTVQFGRDVLWPSLVAGAYQGNWKITAFMSVRQSDLSKNKPDKEDLIEYLKFFNEESAEAGVSFGRKDGSDIRASVKDERNTFRKWNVEYVFACGYVRKENKDMLTALIDGNGKMEYFEDIRTVVGEYEENEQILSWITDKIILQNATTNAYTHSYKDSLMLKSLETALGYSNIEADIYQVFWPESREDEWEKVAEKLMANIDTYWKPYAAFDKTTISESDSRVRNFLNGSVESTRSGNQILIRTRDYAGDAYLLLRTHGEKPERMTGGTWKLVEKDTYLLNLTSEQASITLIPEVEGYYHK